ncbi:MAG: hypothetical protein OSA99_18495, partial [Acidimicrobiales bacterium]|nr:hypothetical protein [Acidimicrobiales bacterium]
MFVALEYPAADIRRFLPGGPWVLDRPDWPDPVTRQDDSTGYDHLRGFGAVEKRRRGGLGTWSGEHAFALAHNALRFPSSLGSAAAAGSNQALRGARVAARRFFNDGTAVARLELGLALRDGDPIDAIRDAATLGVRVPALSGPRLAEFEMRLAHGPIFRNYLRLTTRRGEYEPWWCTPGQPLALVELSADRFDAVAGLTIP